MTKEIIATGRDVNAAIDSGCEQLGIAREDAQFDIISLPKKGFLGLKTYPAKVRVYIELPDPKPQPQPRPRQERSEQKPREERTERREQKPRQERSEKSEQPQQPKNDRRSEQKPRSERSPRPETKPQPQQPAVAEAGDEEAAVRQLRELVEITPTDFVREKVERSAAYVTEILVTMGFEDVKVSPKYYADCVCLQLTGTGLGVIIGRRGETLDSLQYLASLVANRGEGDYIRVNIDSGNYREKRERTLIALAKKLANNAVRTGKSTTLEPMNPYERRVIHGAVSQVKGATSSSVGVDPNRRVVISATGAPKGGQGGQGASRGGRGGRDNNRSRGGRGGRDNNRSRDNKGVRDNRDTRERTPRPESGNEIKTLPQNYPAAAPRDVSQDVAGLESVPRGVPIVAGSPAPKAEKPVTAAPVAPKVERSQQEVEATKKASLYGKIEL
ncbi:MAG: RNA-binding cell elongation regulator Jag/EloR [Angelakisella sp.]|nr:RNA-binding cell elongation regulator Jag/EloR [Angelakisella sp.]